MHNDKRLGLRRHRGFKGGAAHVPVVERCDISEEVMRLGAHLDQFASLCDRREPVGRTMDFLTQELLREANTIASKSNDAAIARAVVEMKSLIDRLKEQVQNVE